MDWNVTLELGEPEIDEQRADDMMDALVDFHPAIGAGYRNRPRITVTLQAETARQAVTTAAALTEAAGGAPAIYVEALPTEEFDIREGFVPVPSLLSVSDAGDYLGVSRVRVNQMIDEGRFPTAQKVGNTYVIPTDAVWQDARMRTMIGWTGVQIADEHVRQVVDPLLESLRLVGPVAAFNAAAAVERGELVSSSLADAWREAEADAIHELTMLGYDTSAARMNAQRAGTRVGSGWVPIN